MNAIPVCTLAQEYMYCRIRRRRGTRWLGLVEWIVRDIARKFTGSTLTGSNCLLSGRAFPFSPVVVFRGPKRNWHARGPFCNFRAPKLIFWLPSSQPIPKLPTLASLPITSSQNAPSSSLRFPTTGCSQLGIKTTALEGNRAGNHYR